MTDIIRKDTDYAMRILVCLAVNNNEKPVATKVLAKTQDIPEDFIYKVLRKLARSGLVTSRMGAQGGFKLALKPEQVIFLDVVSAIQGPLTVRKCCLDLEACPRRETCNVSQKLGELQELLVQSLGRITLADVLKEKNKI